MQQYILLNPGPVNVSPRVRQALLRGDLCPREAEFADLLAAVRAKLLQAFAPEGYTGVVVSGSGTLAVEAMIASALPAGGKLLVINNGVYGDRMRQMAEAHRIPTVELTYAWTQAPNPEQIASALSADPAITAVALVQHETTTGLLNPVTEIGRIVRRQGRLFLLDAVSALGGEDLDVGRDSVDLCALYGKQMYPRPAGCSLCVGSERSHGSHAGRSPSFVISPPDPALGGPGATQHPFYSGHPGLVCTRRCP